MVICMSDENVEELVMAYPRRELDEMAKGLGLDPSTYPNKSGVAEAIVMARRARGKEKMEAEVKKMEKPRKGSVKDKINDIKQQAKENVEAVANIQDGVKPIQVGITKLINETEQFTKTMQSKVANMLTATNKQMNETKQYVKDFYG